MKPVKQSDLLDAIISAVGIADRGQPEVPVTEQPSDVRPLRILLAEDSVTNQLLAVGLLTKWGHDVTVANNGCEAVAKLQDSIFDLVLMDVRMPEMDGLQATVAIREREKHTGQHVPIVAMTAHAMKGDREACLAVGMDDYLAKPICQAELCRVLEEMVPAAGVENA